MSVKAIAPIANVMIVLVRIVRSIPKRKRYADTEGAPVAKSETVVGPNRVDVRQP